MKITGRVIMLAWMGVSLVAGTATAMQLSGCEPVTWHDNPRPLQSGRNPTDPPLQEGWGGNSSATVLNGREGCFHEGDAPVAVECLQGAPRCPYEDGDPSGRPCLWVDPDTGNPWYVSSREYRN